MVAELDAALAAVRQAWPTLRWTSPGSWHITLAFYGDVPADQDVARLLARWQRKVAAVPTPVVVLTGAGAFSRPASARVLWTALRGVSDVDAEALRRLGWAAVAAGRGVVPSSARGAQPGRRFRPHLTLARTAAPTDLRALCACLAGFESTPWRVEQVTLVHSLLGQGPGGSAEHRPLAVQPTASASTT